jgi:hypothetical protein
LTSKWSPEVLNEGFVPFPKRLLRCLPKLFSGTGGVEKLATVLAIVDFQRGNLSRDPSPEYLAFVAGIAPENFERNLAQLVVEKLVMVEETETGLKISLQGLLNAIEEQTKE